MPIPFAPIDAATITSLNKGEEAALEKIFRSHFEVLIERATERLKDEKPAVPRLVASVVRELWAERANVKSSAEVEGFINEELRQRARAVRSRMAAVHRFEKSEGVRAHESSAPTADGLWKEIHGSLHKPVVDAAAAATSRRKHAAHDAAEHMRHASERRNWKTPAILIVVFGALLGGGYMWMSKSSRASVITQMLAATDARTVLTRAGQLGNFSLNDSSAIRLGADSKLVYVPNFGKEYRSSMASGTASVKVADGNSLPFEMRVGEVSVTASAGEFAVRDFAEEPARYVQARSDGIHVNAVKSERTLKAGETVVIGRDSVMRDATADEAVGAFGWLDGKLVLKDVTLRESMKSLYRWYALDITVTDTTTFDRRLSLDVPLESSQLAISAVEAGAQLKFEWVQNRMTLKPIPPAPAPRKRR